MKKRQKGWFFPPEKPPKIDAPENVMMEVETKASELIESFLKPEYIKTQHEDKPYNYVVDIYARWYRNYFHFCARYHCPGPHAISPFFEIKFARLEYAGNGLFNLSYMRHTEQWLEIYSGLTVDECFAAVKDDPHFLP
jgi:hypothetical protein